MLGLGLLAFDVAIPAAYASSQLTHAQCLAGSKAHLPGGAAVDPSGNLWIADAVGPDGAVFNGADVFLTKLAPDGTVLRITAFGGSGDEVASAIAFDGLGRLYVVGSTTSTDLPVTPNAHQNSYRGGPADAFVLQVGPDGQTVLYSSYLGGGLRDEAKSVAVDGLGNYYVAGSTTSENFPVTAGALQTQHGGGSTDLFVVRFDANTHAQAYGTYLGGSGEEGSTEEVGPGVLQTAGYVRVAADPNGNAFVHADTNSTDFPVTLGALQTSYGGGFRDAILAKITAAGDAFVFSTLLGGSALDFAGGLAVDPDGHAIVSLSTESSDLPTVAAHQSVFAGSRDGFLAKLSVDGSGLVYATYLGGIAGDSARTITLDASAANVLITGGTKSPVWDPMVLQFRPHYDAYLARVSTAGVFDAIAQYSGSSDDAGLFLTVGDFDEVNIVGITRSQDLEATDPTSCESSLGNTFVIQAVFAPEPAAVALQICALLALVVLARTRSATTPALIGRASSSRPARR